MKNYENLIGKSMYLGEFCKIIGQNIETVEAPASKYVEDKVPMMFSTDVEKDSHTNIFVRFTNNVETYKKLRENDDKDKMYIRVEKIEYWKREKEEK